LRIGSRRVRIESVTVVVTSTSSFRELYSAFRRRIHRFIRRLRSLSPNFVVWHWVEDIREELSRNYLHWMWMKNIDGLMLKKYLSSTFDEVVVSIALAKLFLSAW